MTTNPDGRPEPIIISEFEGETVRLMRGKLPAINLDLPAGYPRGTHLFLRVEARVRKVGVDEITAKEHKGELVRDHDLVIEEVGILDAITAEKAGEMVIGGSAAATTRISELFALGDAPEPCFYDPAQLSVVHQGDCELCRREPEPEAPEDEYERQRREVAEMAGLAGVVEPVAEPESVSLEPDPGF